MQIHASQLITSSTRNSDRPRVVNRLKLPARFADVVAGIARTKKILILSGDSALAGTGLLPLEHPVTVQLGTDVRRLPLLHMIQETAKQRPESLSFSQLGTYNYAMTERRIAARQAGSNMFLEYLHQICEQGRLTKCLTTSIDGLESQLSPALTDAVVPLYGDNRYLRCASSGCKGVSDRKTILLDEKMLSQSPVPCADCNASFKKTNKQRRKGNEATRSLRPAVQHHISLAFTHAIPIDQDEDDLDDNYVELPDSSLSVRGIAGTGGSASASATEGQPQQRTRPKRKIPIELPGIDEAKIKRFHGDSKLLLIVGQQPKDPELLSLTRDLATSVHNGDGAVVYIDPASVQGAQHNHIDIHLQADIQETLGEVRAQMLQLGDHDGEDTLVRCTDADLWFDMIQNDIPIRSTEKETPYLGATCVHCACAITDYLVKCTQCSDHYCFRQFEHEDAEIEDSEDEDEGKNEAPKQSTLGTIPRNAQPSANEIPGDATAPEQGPSRDPSGQETRDKYPYHEACLVFNALSSVRPSPSPAYAAQSFVCPDCWSYTERGLYPHYIRPVARENAEVNMSAWPRIAIVIYYVEQFWPHTKHLMSLTAGCWKQLGWECILEPVKLQHLDEREPVFQDLHWEAGTYQVVAVFITHGLEGEQGYQLNNSQALQPAELLTQTLRIAQKALAGASSSSIFLFSCGHPLHQPSLVNELCQWMKRETSPAVLIGCLNKKLSPAYMFPLFAKLTQALADESEKPSLTIRKAWLRDTVALSHSDLLCLTKDQPGELWLYAPFRSRPLGKALPSLFNVCPCTPRRTGDGQNDNSKRARKVWKVKVKPKAVAGAKLRELTVEAICQACRQTWVLPHETLDGHLVRVNGEYGAVVPYFVEGTYVGQ